ncbi:hypothetical protein HA052_18790 [Chromobacterium haemolyticum]|uniref:Uncharacterized protein n=1 Tax=Chromobacterium fluminis TaxID=3044269 RepID=A0ABX0LCV0_9NEIS|nr:hypothetical protein [Chromobacterium haemolyticum]NHR07241.1 hypothetical protein [Chromobacterium haemolyticum]
MNIYVGGLQCATGPNKDFPVRSKLQSVVEYAQACLNDSCRVVMNAISIALKNKDQSCPLFFTLPEFFWNVRWSDVYDINEISLLSDFYLDKLSDKVGFILRGMPVDVFGKVILLAGTVATLIKTKEGLYEPINYCLVVDNFSDVGGAPSAVSALPKRNTSTIDFGKPDAVDVDYYIAKLSDSLHIPILNKSMVASEHNSAEGYGEQLNNKLLDGCPFSIDICLDYERLNFDEQKKSLMNANTKIDFLLACGMPINEKHRYPDSVQYAVRNDGASDGTVEFFSVSKNRIFQKITPESLIFPANLEKSALVMAKLEIR